MVKNLPTVPPPMRFISAQRAFVTAVVLLLGWLAWSLRDVLAPYVVGILLVQLLLPLVHVVEKHLPGRSLRAETRRRIAALTVYLSAALVLILFLLFAARRTLNRMGDMILGLPAFWHNAISENSTIHAWYVETIPADIRAQIEKSLAAASIDVASWLQRTVMSAIDTASGLVDTVVTIAAIVLFVFWVMLGDERLPRAASSWISPDWRVHLQRLGAIAHDTVTSYARALLTEATIVGSLTGIGLFLVGVDFALPLAIASGFCNLIPYIGYWMALLLSIVVVAGSQPDKLALTIVIYLGVQSLDNWIFAPHFQGGSTGWTPAQALVLMACGSALIGPIGLVISLPLAAFVRETLLYTYRQLAPAPSQDHAGAEPALDQVGQREPAPR